MHRLAFASLLAIGSAVAACSSDTTDFDPTGSGTDAGTLDAAADDSGVSDAGADLDAAGTDASEPDAGGIDPVAEPFRTIRNSGSSETKLDLVFVGDGYTLEELDGAYAEHVDALAEGMFREVRNNVTEPFRRYRTYFNVHRVHVASAESGVDEDGVDRDTAFDGRDTCDGTGCYVDPQKVHAAVDAALAGTDITADWIVVTLNTNSKVAGVVESDAGNIAVYAGGFGDGQVRGYRARELGMRELAKAFCNVDYETVTEDAAYTGPEPEALNLTATATAPKWTRWVGYDVNRDGLTEVGAYEGGGGFETGIYRPTQESKMGAQVGDDTHRFDAVTREAVIMEIYRYVPLVTGQEPEAGTTHTDPVVLFVNTSGSPEVEWAINGAVVSEQTDPALGITDYARINGIPAGTYTVTARIFDDTDWVRAVPRTGLEEIVTWTVELTGN